MDIQSTIERYILDEIMMKDGETRIDPDQSLVSSGVIDSLTLLRLIVFIEEKFGIKIDDDEVVPENFETINVIKSFVQNRM